MMPYFVMGTAKIEIRTMGAAIRMKVMKIVIHGIIDKNLVIISNFAKEKERR